MTGAIGLMAMLMLGTALETTTPSPAAEQAEPPAASSTAGGGEVREDPTGVLIAPPMAGSEDERQQPTQQTPSLKQGALVGAAAGCTFVGVLLARAAPADTRTAAFITGCALGAPLGAIAGFFAVLGNR